MSTTKLYVAVLWAAVIAGPIAQTTWGQAARPAGDGLNLFGRVTAVAADGKGVTVETAPQQRGEELKKVEIKFDAATQIVYQSVGPDGAKPTEGYNMRFALAAGSKDVAASVAFSSPTVGQADVIGRIASISSDGKTIAVEGRPTARGEEAKKIDVQLNDATRVSFQSVGPDGAKLAEGQFVQVWLQPESKGVALRLNAAAPSGEGRGERRAPDVEGRVSAVSADGKTVTLQTPPANRGDEPKKVDIKLVDATQINFSNVTPGGAQPKEGYFAAVQLLAGTTDVAANVRFIGADREAMDVAGRVSSVSSDGKIITVEMPPTARGEEPKRREIKLGDKARVVYNNVGPDGAKPTEGYFAQVLLEPGSADSAARVNFFKPGERR
jgi:hypothetical protein